MNTPLPVSPQVKNELATVLDELVVSKLEPQKTSDFIKNTSETLENIKNTGEELQEFCEEELGDLPADLKNISAIQTQNGKRLQTVASKQDELKNEISSVSENVSAIASGQSKNLETLQKELSSLSVSISRLSDGQEKNLSTLEQEFSSLSENVSAVSKGQSDNLSALQDSLSAIADTQTANLQKLQEELNLLLENQNKNAAVLTQLEQKIFAANQQTNTVYQAVTSMKKWLIAVLGLCSLSTAVAIAVLLITVL